MGRRGDEKDEEDEEDGTFLEPKKVPKKAACDMKASEIKLEGDAGFCGGWATGAAHALRRLKSACHGALLARICREHLFAIVR